MPRFARRAVLSGGMAALLAACGNGADLPRARLSLSETLGGADTAGYARALAPRPFTFPEDHGPHPAFRNEWWYVTGNLEGEGGRLLGFQFTLFRSALSPRAPGGPSAWSTNQAYMAHFTVTDGEEERFRAFQRFARGGAGLAGVNARPFRAWIDDWSLEGDVGLFPLRLRAAEEEVAVDLTFARGKPMVLQGEDGWSRKGPEAGNASFYYSFTRMPTEGRVVIGADTLRVSGLSWLDREWSTSALSEGQVGWDWFALQLDNGWDLMVYVLREDDGSVHALSDGVLIDPYGARTPLAWGTDLTLTPTGSWTSPLDGAVYPSGWTLTLARQGWTLDVEPLLRDQELDLAFRYWEGAVRVRGRSRDGTPLTGHGYVELTGYAGEVPER